ncbi:hypothetical protein RRG08_028070 [Elysia crispata]|uniref:Uncharacterized protein n=1 Tax=Elysia crispata TaxID=231223 RepID=A0AAE1A7U9_9GAST|nr:hypothetical protein RRG08_028070 [Elysia crispata]
MGVKGRAILNSNTDPELRQNGESNYEDQYFDIDMLKLGLQPRTTSLMFNVKLHRKEPLEAIMIYQYVPEGPQRDKGGVQSTTTTYQRLQKNQ